MMLSPINNGDRLFVLAGMLHSRTRHPCTPTATAIRAPRARATLASYASERPRSHRAQRCARQPALFIDLSSPSTWVRTLCSLRSSSPDCPSLSQPMSLPKFPGADTVLLALHVGRVRSEPAEVTVTKGRPLSPWARREPGARPCAQAQSCRLFIAARRSAI